MIRLLFGLAAVIWFFASSPRAAAQTLRAESGGVVIGRDAKDTTINIGIPPEQLAALLKQSADLSETQKKLIAELEQKLALNQQQVRAALAILGEANIPPEQLGSKLVEVAERFKDLRATASPQTGDDPKIAALKIEARKAIDAGKLAEADALLATIEAEQRRSLDRLAVNAAATLAQRGEIALTRLRYADAAKHFADAAAVFPPGSSHETERMRYLDREAQAHYRQGDEFGDNDALQTAIARYKRLVELTPERACRSNGPGRSRTLVARSGNSASARAGRHGWRRRSPCCERRWKNTPVRACRCDGPTTQTSLGNALQALGERESGTTRLEEAVAAYRAALEENTRARVPLEWAQTQMNLGVALWVLGDARERDGAGWRRRSPPIGRRWKKTLARACRSNGP